ncbi:MAG: zinc-finger domain-containing protein [Gammaproteobacteria bacterium]
MSAVIDARELENSTPNAQREVEVTAADLPLHCPLPGTSLWNSHPRVFIPIADSPDGKAECPYCGTRFVLKG